MLFNSYVFILGFLPIVLLGFFTLSKIRHSWATAFLVIASFFFYGWWDMRYIPLLFLSICWNFSFGRIIEAAVAHRRKLWLTIAVAGNIALLGYYKYTGFFLQTLDDVCGFSFDIPNIILPLGISFYTFTQTAYLIDAYRGETRKYSFLTYLLFVTIYPHLIAGPIIHHQDMIPQFSRVRHFVVDYRNLSMGTALFLMGLCKKVFIADQLSPWVSNVFSHTGSLSVIEAWTGAIAYTYQLYFDFSGYSEMAIGLGLMLNLKFPINFDSPYQSLSIIDFWRRWHMTLGHWVKSYLYIPLGGNRHGELKKMRNLFASMLIIGLWHGAGWTFVLWGGMHGAFLVINHQWRRLNIELPHTICWGLTFLCVVICWVFFRAESFGDGCQVISAMLGLNVPLLMWTLPVGRLKAALILLILTIVVLKLRNPQRLLDQSFCSSKKWLVIVVFIGLLAMVHMHQYSEFLYFQF